MKVAVTGATGFIGRYIVRHLLDTGHACRCWYRSQAVGSPPSIDPSVEWIPGELGDRDSCRDLVDGCQAVIHAALFRPGKTFRGGEGSIEPFVQTNVLGTIQLMEAARLAGVRRFVFISTCAVHERILDDRPLDEAHPLWMTTHYGAHKAAIEQFVHSYGFGMGFPVCALRPTGVYGRHHAPEQSKWYDLVGRVVRSDTVDCRKGGKEVHAADVARCAELLLHADGVSGEVYNCYDRYVSEYDVAHLARKICGSRATIQGKPTRPQHEIVTEKVRALGMTFGGDDLLERTVAELIEAVSEREQNGSSEEAAGPD